MSKNLREYEIMIIAKGDLPESDVLKLHEKWESILTRSGGQMIHKDVWGLKRFAYPIEKQSRGHYVVYDVATPVADAHELKRLLKNDENVVRSLFLRLSDKVDIEGRRTYLRQQAEAAAQRASELARERAENDSMDARRGGQRSGDDDRDSRGSRDRDDSSRDRESSRG